MDYENELLKAMEAYEDNKVRNTVLLLLYFTINCVYVSVQNFYTCSSIN